MQAKAAIPIRTHWNVINKWASGLSSEVIAGHLCIGERTVQRIVAIYRTYGDVTPLPSARGRTRMLSADHLEYLRLLIRESPDLYLDELAEEMSTYLAQSVSKSLIWNTLRRMGYTRKQVRSLIVIHHIPLDFSLLHYSWPALHLNVMRLDVPCTGCK